MDSKKYIGMDVHKESIASAVINGAGKIVMACVIETKASMILQFYDGPRGDLHVTFEEGTSAAWLYDLLKSHVAKSVVCDPRKNKSMREGSQSDKIDARRWAELLRLDHLTPVYHGEHGLRTLKELVRSYLTVTKGLTRVMSRVKAIYRSWAIPCTGKQVYATPSGRVAREVRNLVRLRIGSFWSNIAAVISFLFRFSSRSNPLVEVVDYDDGLVDQVGLSIDQGFSAGGDAGIEDVVRGIEEFGYSARFEIVIGQGSRGGTADEVDAVCGQGPIAPAA
jgi:hypothetical protein